MRGVRRCFSRWRLSFSSLSSSSFEMSLRLKTLSLAAVARIDSGLLSPLLHAFPTFRSSSVSFFFLLYACAAAASAAAFAAASAAAEAAASAASRSRRCASCSAFDAVQSRDQWPRTPHLKQEAAVMVAAAAVPAEGRGRAEVAIVN